MPPLTAKSDRPVWLGEDSRGWDHARIHRDILGDPRLGAYEIAVYVGLAIHAETRTGAASPAAATLAAYANMSERRARLAIRGLEATGWIQVVHRPGSASVYHLCPPPSIEGHGLDTPVPGAEVSGPDGGESETPDLAPTPVGGAAHPGTSCRTPRHQTTPTPAPGADEREPRTRSIKREPRTNSLPGLDNGPDTTPPTTDDGFAAFWDLYPRKVAKGAARKAWTAATKQATPEAILAGLHRFVDETRGADQKYLPHAATWLRADRWTDAPGANRRNGATQPTDPLPDAVMHGPSGIVNPKDL